MRSRSNSAKGAKIPNTRRPFAMVVSISAPGAGEHPESDLAVAQFVHRVHQVLRIASSRLSFHTTSVLCG